MCNAEQLKCTICKKQLPIDSFQRDKTRKSRNGRSATCKVCKAIREKKYRKEHPEVSKKWREKNLDKIHASARKHYYNNLSKMKTRSRRKYLYLVENNPEKLKEYYNNFKNNSPQKYAFNVYKRNAKNRGIAFELSFSDFIKLWKVPCVYCGGNIEKVGIDRVDNNLGYSIDNIVSCCSVCNRMKMDHGYSFFIQHCSKIHHMTQVVPLPNEAEP